MLKTKKAGVFLMPALLLCLLPSCIRSPGNFKGGTRLVFKLDLGREPDLDGRVLKETGTILQERLRAAGVRNHRLKEAPPDRLVLEIPTVDRDRLEYVKKIVVRRGELSLQLVARGKQNARTLKKYTEEEAQFKVAEAKWAQKIRLWAEKKNEKPDVDIPCPKRPSPTPYVVRDMRGDRSAPSVPSKAKGGQTKKESFLLENKPKTTLRRDDFMSFYLTQDTNVNFAIGFDMTPKGATRLGDLTANNLKAQLAIVIDGEILSAPIIQSVISERGIITGGFSRQEAKNMVAVLQSGQLPVPIKLATEEALPESYPE